MDLTTRYMGLTLKNPFVASASPLSESLDAIRRLEDNGASAVVMFSLFEEQIRHDSAAVEHFMTVGTESFGEALSYFPAVRRLRRRSRAVPRSHPQGHRSRRHPDHREPQRRQRARVGRPSREEMEDAGAKRHRAERVLHPDRDVPLGRRRSNSSTSTCCQAVKATVSIPVADQGRSLLQLVCGHGRPARGGGRRRPGALQPLLSAGLRHREPGPWPPR